MRTLTTFALVVVAAGTASAQLTVKQATSQLKAAGKATIGAAKDQFDLLRAGALLTIESFEQAVEADGFDKQVAADFFGELNTFTGAVATELRTSCQDLAAEATEITNQIDDPEVLEGSLPPAFAAGAGGTLDDTLAKLRAAAEKTGAAVFKRLGKTIKLLDKAGVRLVVTRRPLSAAQAAYAGSTLTLGEPANLTLDLAMTLRSAAAPDDGLVCLGGEANVVTGDVNVGVGETQATATPGEDFRWSQFFGLGTGMPEGNAFCSVAPALGGMQDSLIIAVR